MDAPHATQLSLAGAACHSALDSNFHNLIRLLDNGVNLFLFANLAVLAVLGVLAVVGVLAVLGFCLLFILVLGSSFQDAYGFVPTVAVFSPLVCRIAWGNILEVLLVFGVCSCVRFLGPCLLCCGNEVAVNVKRHVELAIEIAKDHSAEGTDDYDMPEALMPMVVVQCGDTVVQVVAGLIEFMIGEPDVPICKNRVMETAAVRPHPLRRAHMAMLDRPMASMAKPALMRERAASPKGAASRKGAASPAKTAKAPASPAKTAKTAKTAKAPPPAKTAKAPAPKAFSPPETPAAYAPASEAGKGHIGVDGSGSGNLRQPGRVHCCVC